MVQAFLWPLRPASTAAQRAGLREDSARPPLRGRGLILPLWGPRGWRWSHPEEAGQVWGPGCTPRIAPSGGTGYAISDGWRPPGRRCGAIWSPAQQVFLRGGRMRGGAANCRGGQPCPRGGDGVRFTEQVGLAPRGWRCPAGWGRAAEVCPGSGRRGSSARPRPRPRPPLRLPVQVLAGRGGRGGPQQQLGRSGRRNEEAGGGSLRALPCRTGKRTPQPGPPHPPPGITPQLGMGARPAELQSRREPEQGVDTRPLCPPPSTERLCTVQASQRPWESRCRLAGGSQSRFLLLRDLFCPGCSAPTLPGATSRNGNCVGPHSTGCCSVEGRPRARRSPNH